MSRAKSIWLCCACVLSLTASCDDAKERGPATGLGDGDGDGDGDRDGGTGDGDGDGDADADGDGGDGDADADGGGPDGSTVEPPILECNVAASDRFEDDVALVGRRAFAMAASGNDMHLLYVSPTCVSDVTGKVTGTGLKYAKFSTSGDLPAPTPFFNNDPENCEDTSDPAIAVFGDTVRGYFVARDGSDLELQRLDLGSTGGPLSLTNVAEREAWVTANVLGTTPILLWTTGDAVGAEAISALRDDVSPLVQEFMPLAQDHAPAQLVLQPIGTSTLAAGWVSTGANTGVYLQTMDKFGAPLGDIQLTTPTPGAAPGLDVALLSAPESSSAIGAVVYTSGTGDAQEIRFRSFDGTGRIATTDKSVSPGGANARDPSITPYGNGYAIAYRAWDGPSLSVRVIQVAFVDAQGTLAGYRNASIAAPGGGAVRARQALDGRLLLAWVDDGPEGPTLRALRAACE
jgi:hypothetical protein